jgi:hypothetical protein
MTSDAPTPEPERDRDLDALEAAESELAALESELEAIDGTRDGEGLRRSPSQEPSAARATNGAVADADTQED